MEKSPLVKHSKYLTSIRRTHRMFFIFSPGVLCKHTLILPNAAASWALASSFPLRKEVVVSGNLSFPKSFTFVWSAVISNAWVPSQDIGGASRHWSQTNADCTRIPQAYNNWWMGTCKESVLSNSTNHSKWDVPCFLRHIQFFMNEFISWPVFS